MWGSLCFVSLAFSYVLVPETKGLTLEQVDRMLEETSPRTSAKWVPHSTFAADMGLADKDLEIAAGSGGNTDVEAVQAETTEKSIV